MARILLMAAVAALIPASVDARSDHDRRLETMLIGRQAGEAVDCISLSRVTSSEIVDGQAIVYRSGGTLYVNRPRSGADSLRDDDILVMKVFGSQLCSVDTVRLVDRAGRSPRGFVQLGRFVPYRAVKG